MASSQHIVYEKLSILRNHLKEASLSTRPNPGSLRLLRALNAEINDYRARSVDTRFKVAEAVVLKIRQRIAKRCCVHCIEGVQARPPMELAIAVGIDCLQTNCILSKSFAQILTFKPTWFAHTYVSSQPRLLRLQFYPQSQPTAASFYDMRSVWRC